MTSITGCCARPRGVPSTAHITAMQFCQQYAGYVDAGYTDVLHVTINSTGSATYDAAVMAQGLLREERPEHKLRIHLVDSHTYSFVYGKPVCEAARKLKKRRRGGIVVAELEKEFACQEIVLSAFSLKQMKRAGASARPRLLRANCWACGRLLP